MEVKRVIAEFMQDENSDWVAILQCGHRQHVRHNPPWQNRPWVVHPDSRDEKLGCELICKECSESSPG
jgi:hypothetical protein